MTYKARQLEVTFSLINTNNKLIVNYFSNVNASWMSVLYEMLQSGSIVNETTKVSRAAVCVNNNNNNNNTTMFC